MGTSLAKNTEYVLRRPYYNWDMNYHLIELETNKEYLIDINDVRDNMEDVEKYGGILYDRMLELDIDEIKEIAWKVI